MEQISSHGSKGLFSVIAILALSVCTVFATYRLKKTAQIKLWEKEFIQYSKQLEAENQIAKGEPYLLVEAE